MKPRPSQTPRQLDVLQSDICAERLKALSEPLRLRIVDLLRNGEFTVSEIALRLETEVVTVSHHLQILKNARLVASRRAGRFVYYSLSEDVLQKRGKSMQLLDLGCCAIELPLPAEEA